MGFVGNFLKTILNPDVESAQTAMPTITGRDLVSSTSSLEPDAPKMGADTKKKGGGTSSLLVPNESIYRGR